MVDIDPHFNLYDSITKTHCVKLMQRFGIYFLLFEQAGNNNYYLLVKMYPVKNCEIKVFKWF